MQPLFDITIEGSGAGAVMRLSLRRVPGTVRRVQFRTRDGQRSHQVPIDVSAGGTDARLPLELLVDERPLRWDVQIDDAAGDGFVQLGGTAPSGRPRHFFRAAHGAHGISAYLSDSAASLVLFSAPREQHERTVEVEDARAGFADMLRELPLQDDLVLFESFLGKGYAGNPRYIYEALREMRPDLRCVWAYTGSASIPGDPQRVARGSAEYYRLLAQAKYRVNNIMFAAHGRKPETRYLQTWHGTPLKRLGRDIEVAGPGSIDPTRFEAESRESAVWTTLLSGNGYSSGIFRRAFGYPGEMLEAGYPLTDPLLDPGLDREAIATRLGLPAGHRFVLYAPTWRDHRPVGHWRFDFDLQLDLAAVAAVLEPDQILLVRAHHLVAAGLDEATLPPNVRNVSHVDDATDLCAIADVLVTDYSSLFFDYAVTGRPILFYCYDLELYASQVRGFYLDPETDLPGPVARDTGQLLELLRDLPAVQARHAARYAGFRERFCAWNDGQAARRVVQAFFGAAP